MRQQLVWMPKGARRGSVPLEGKRPDHVWTLYMEKTDETCVPSLPYAPVHLKNAFIEDHMHDWIVRGGVLSYFSRVVNLCDHGVWLLLEWKDEDSSHPPTKEKK